MSIFIPYTPTQVLDYLISIFSLDFSSLTAYETTIITIFANLYFFVFWGIIITIFANLYFFVFWGIIVYFSLKIFNRIWERFF